MKLALYLATVILSVLGHAEVLPAGINWMRSSTQSGLEGIVTITHYDASTNFLWGVTMYPVGIIKIDPETGETIDFYPTGNDDDVQVDAFVARPMESNDLQVHSFLLMIEGKDGKGTGRMAAYSTMGEEMWSNELGDQGILWNAETVSPFFNDEEFNRIFVNFRTNMVLGAFDADSGALVWSNPASNIELGRMTSLGIMIYAGRYRSQHTAEDFKPTVMRFSQDTGEVTANWTLDCNAEDCLGSIQGAPVIGVNHDVIYFSDVFAGNIALGLDLSEQQVGLDSNQYFPYRMATGEYLYGVTTMDGGLAAVAYPTGNFAEARWLFADTKSPLSWAGDVLFDGPKVFYLQQNGWFCITSMTGEVVTLWTSDSAGDTMLSMALSPSNQNGVNQALYVSYQTGDFDGVLISFSTDATTLPPVASPTKTPVSVSTPGPTDAPQSISPQPIEVTPAPANTPKPTISPVTPVVADASGKSLPNSTNVAYTIGFVVLAFLVAALALYLFWSKQCKQCLKDPSLESA